MEIFRSKETSRSTTENVGLSPLRRKFAIALMSALGALSAAGCSIVGSSVSHPGGSVKLRNGRLEVCSENQGYVDDYRKHCRQGTIETFTRGDEQCMRCDGK